jgi:hypothetical protein
MATSEAQSIPSWNDAEVMPFLEYLLANKSRVGKSGSFPMAVYNTAAVEIAKHHTAGPATRQELQNKVECGIYFCDLRCCS